MKNKLYNTHYFLYETTSDYSDYYGDDGYLDCNEIDELNENMVEKYIYILEDIVKLEGYDISKLQEKL